MPTTIDAMALKAALGDGGEIALLDVREGVRFAAGHLLLAINIPLDQLDRVIVQFVPRPGTRIVLCDDADRLGERAAEALRHRGYHDVAVLEDGIDGWRAEGFELFERHYALANMLGVYIGDRCATPRITAEALKAELDSGEDVMVIDTRPGDEFHAVSIPGATNAPLAELFYRARDLVPDARTHIVVNCAGTTRGVLGCQSLLEADLGNPVSALIDGTMGWDFAGYALDHGAAGTIEPVSAEASAWAQRAAHALAERFGVRTINRSTLDQWRAEVERRTLYLVDVRTQEEYESGHIADSVWIPGGQLAAVTEDYLATRNARICIVDDDGARATLAASWLNRAGGFEVAVLEGGLTAQALQPGAAATVTVAHAGAPEPDREGVLAGYGRAIAWRSALLDQLERDGTLRYPATPP